VEPGISSPVLDRTIRPRAARRPSLHEQQVPGHIESLTSEITGTVCNF